MLMSENNSLLRFANEEEITNAILSVQIITAVYFVAFI